MNVLKGIGRYGQIAAAIVWRRLLVRTTIIAVAGSYGKTTTKECLARVLSAHFPTISTRGSFNGGRGMARTVLRVRPWHRFAVVEVGIQKPGHMRKARWQLSPDIVIVTTVGKAHSMFLGDQDAIAKEKAELLGGLSTWGVAVLNRNDHRVASMASGLRCRVMWFGSTPDCDVWCSDVERSWPTGMNLRLHQGPESAAVQTRLLGAHWSLAAPAAAAAAYQCGVSVAAAAEALDGMPPSHARLEPVLLSSGATFIRDESNGSLPTLPTAMQVLSDTGAKRRIALLADFYDGPDDDEERACVIAELALVAATHVVFLGERSEALAATAARVRGSRAVEVLAFPVLKDAAMFLGEFLGPGDVALIKGPALDHMQRIFYSQRGEVDCWLQKCGVTKECDNCSRLGDQYVGEGV